MLGVKIPVLAAKNMSGNICRFLLNTQFCHHKHGKMSWWCHTYKYGNCPNMSVSNISKDLRKTRVTEI